MTADTGARPRHGLWWVAMVLWMGLIFFLSHQQPADLVSFGAFDLLLKKAGHFIGYAVLALLAVRALGSWHRALMVAVLYAITDEYHQTFVPGRMGAWSDVGIDALGGATALWLRARFKA